MNKRRMSELMQLANDALKEAEILNKDNSIDEAYNGHTSAFAVSVAMNGLLPALAIYYQRAGESRKTDRRKILKAIGCMIGNDASYTPEPEIADADSLLQAAISKPDSKALKCEVLDCATALKQIIRTYELK